MVAARADPALEFGPSAAAKSPTLRRRAGGRRLARAAVFACVTGLVLLYALRGGGSYDLVTFEEDGLVIWWILAIGIALGLLPRSRPSRVAWLFLAALAAYAAWTGVSHAWTTSSELTTVELARALDYLGVASLLIFLLNRDTWRAAAAGLGFGALVVCVVAVGSRLAPSVFGTDQIDAAFHIDRLSRPFGYWNSVAAWAAMCVAIGLAWSAHDASRMRRALALALVPVAGLTSYLTYSRAGVAGEALASVAVLGFSRNRFTALVHLAVAATGTGAAILVVRAHPQIAHATGTQGAAAVLGALLLAIGLCGVIAFVTGVTRVDRLRLPRRAVRPVLALGAAVMLLAGAGLGPRVASRAWNSFTRAPVTQNSPDPAARLTSLSGSRYPLWKAALRAFDEHPLDGTGAGTVEFWWNQHATNGEFVRDAHSIWLENMAELGTPGLLLIIAVALSAVALAVTALRRTRRNVSRGAAAALAAAFVVYLLHASVDWMWESTAATVLAIAGVACVGARLSEGRIRLSVAVRAGLALTAVFAAILQLPGLLSTLDIRHSQAAERANNPSLALAWARQAISAEPWSASAYEQRGLVWESVGQLGQAAQDLNRAISDEPQNYAHWLILARVETERGQLQAARRAYNRARHLRPLASVFVLAPYFTPFAGAGIPTVQPAR